MGEMQFYGKELVNRLFTMMRISRTHTSTHPLVRASALNLIKAINDLAEDNEVKLEVTLDMLRINEEWLRPGLSNQAVYSFIVAELSKREVGGITFSQSLTADEVIAFIHLLNQSEGYQELEEKMAGLGINNISIREPRKGGGGGRELAHQDVKRRSIEAFARGFVICQEMLSAVKNNQAVNFRGAKRVVQSMVDIVVEDDSVLMALAAFKHHDDYTFKHSANVSVYCIVLGNYLGLDRRSLAYLGMAGLFHDIGKLLVPKEILCKPAKLDQEEWEVMQRHVIFGANYLINHSSLNEIMANSIIAAYEHHLDANLTGYPRIIKERRLDLFSRIVSIADAYDALTNARVYRQKVFTPVEALTLMVEKMGYKFDGELLRAFTRAVGIYPVGTVVRLNTGEIALVYRLNRQPKKMLRPIVKLFADASGNRLEPQLLDLSEQDEQGNYPRHIAETLDSHQHFPDYKEYLEML